MAVTREKEMHDSNKSPLDSFVPSAQTNKRVYWQSVNVRVTLKKGHTSKSVMEQTTDGLKACKDIHYFFLKGCNEWCFPLLSIMILANQPLRTWGSLVKGGRWKDAWLS